MVAFFTRQNFSFQNIIYCPWIIKTSKSLAQSNPGYSSFYFPFSIFLIFFSFSIFSIFSILKTVLFFSLREIDSLKVFLCYI